MFRCNVYVEAKICVLGDKAVVAKSWHLDSCIEVPMNFKATRFGKRNNWILGWNNCKSRRDTKYLLNFGRRNSTCSWKSFVVDEIDLYSMVLWCVTLPNWGMTGNIKRLLKLIVPMEKYKEKVWWILAYNILTCKSIHGTNE